MISISILEWLESRVMTHLWLEHINRKPCLIEPHSKFVLQRRSSTTEVKMKFLALVLASIGAVSAGYISPGGYSAPVVGGFGAPVAAGYHAGGVGGYSSPVVGGYSAPVVGGYSAPVVGGYHGAVGGYSAPALGGYQAAVTAAPIAASSLGYSAPGFGYNGLNGGYAAPGFGYNFLKKKKASA